MQPPGAGCRENQTEPGAVGGAASTSDIVITQQLALLMSKQPAAGIGRARKEQGTACRQSARAVFVLWPGRFPVADWGGSNAGVCVCVSVCVCVCVCVCVWVCVYGCVCVCVVIFVATTFGPFSFSSQHFVRSFYVAFGCVAQATKHLLTKSAHTVLMVGSRIRNFDSPSAVVWLWQTKQEQQREQQQQ